MPKIGVGRTTVKGEKKEDGHNSQGNSTVQKDSAMRSQCVHLLSVGGEEKIEEIGQSEKRQQQTPNFTLYLARLVVFP